jgi:site-specific DNA-methyltransferase (adenine-specific)
LHCDPTASHYLKLICDAVFCPQGGNFLNEIIWSYRTGGVGKQWFSRKHDVLFFYAKQTGQHVFHVQRSGEFRTEGMNYDETGRPYKSTKKGRLYFNSEGPTMTDVWEMPFLSTVSLERLGYPTQKPEALLERVIKASSNEGDVILDAYCGCGSHSRGSSAPQTPLDRN